MKRLAPLFFLLWIVVLTACSSQTTTTISQVTYQYIVYQEVVYMESQAGYTHENDEILIDFQSDRTIFTASFSEATVTVFADGSLTAVYEDGWIANCSAEGSIDECSLSAINPSRTTEVTLLLGFRDVVILTGDYTPHGETPLNLLILDWKLLVIMIFAGLVFYRILILVLPRGVRGLFYPSKSLMGGIFNKNPGGGRGHDVRNYWANADVSVGSLKDDFDNRYGKPSLSPDQTPPSTLRERFRVQWPYLLVSVVLFVLALVSTFIW